MTLVAAVLMVGAFLQSAPKTHFDVTAAFNPPRGGSPGEVAVQFVARDPDVKINEIPAPRLKLVSGPATVAVSTRSAPPDAAPPAADGSGRYLDLTLPVTFPVTLDPAAPRGIHDAKGSLTYFYCSKREGWCRKGTAEVTVPITVP